MSTSYSHRVLLIDIDKERKTTGIGRLFSVGRLLHQSLPGYKRQEWIGAARQHILMRLTIQFVEKILWMLPNLQTTLLDLSS
jgi:hypothetical protein